jgi:hypothetical protein
VRREQEGPADGDGDGARAARAAPPDDGHLGAYTRPDETLSSPDSGEGRPAPALHVDVTGEPPARHGIGLYLAITLLAALLLAAFFAWAGL